MAHVFDISLCNVFPVYVCVGARRVVVIIDVNSEINDAEHRSGAPGSRKKKGHVSTHTHLSSRETLVRPT